MPRIRKKIDAAKKEKENKENSFKRNEPGNRIIPLTGWNKYHDWPSQSGLRHMVFFREENGFKNAFLRCGRKILIDEKAFFDVLRNQN